jgi:hypothetical protein
MEEQINFLKIKKNQNTISNSTPEKNDEKY